MNNASCPPQQRGRRKGAAGRNSAHSHFKWGKNEARQRTSYGLLRSTYQDGSESLCHGRRSEAWWAGSRLTRLYVLCQTGATPSPVRADWEGEGRCGRERREQGKLTMFPIFSIRFISKGCSVRDPPVVAFGSCVSEVKGQRGSFSLFSLCGAFCFCHGNTPLIRKKVSVLNSHSTDFYF